MADANNIKAGDTFGYLTAIKPVKKGSKHTQWLFRCKCGREVIKIPLYLTSTKTPSCGCAVNRYFDTNNKEKLKRSETSIYWHDDAKCNIDLTGKKIGYLSVIKKTNDIIGVKAEYLCECECGKQIIKKQHALTYAKTMISCGCKRKKPKPHPSTPEAKLKLTYNRMKSRCYNKNNTSYKYYGKRGIVICDEWLGENGFTNFYNWAMQNGYKQGLSIDRIDVYGNYEPSNCRWADDFTQANNRTNSIHVLYNGKELPLSTFSEIIGVKYTDIYNLIEKGCCYSGEYIEKTLKG